MSEYLVAVFGLGMIVSIMFSSIAFARSGRIAKNADAVTNCLSQVTAALLAQQSGHPGVQASAVREMLRHANVGTTSPGPLSSGGPKKQRVTNNTGVFVTQPLE